MNTYEVGDKVKITVDDYPYLGVIITYSDNVYKVSVEGLGKVVDATDSDLEALGE